MVLDLTFENGKLVSINAITELDKSGRIVLPKKIRDAMHLRAGDRLTVDLSDDRLVIAPERNNRGLYQDRGWIVFDSGISAASALTEDESADQIEDARNARMDFLAGERTEP
jgi:AbrB family looped-hinge helix DNA binding protein